jgi:hypothetical protein
MNVSKLIDKLKDILSEERKAQLAKYSSLKKVLKSLKHEKNRLKDELENTRDEAYQRELESQLEIIRAQRKKGLKVLKKLKKERDKSGH